MKNGEAEKRATKRWQVGLPTECTLAESVAGGLVRDITEAGAFVASDRERDRSGIRALSASPLERLLQVGDRFLLTFIQSTVMNRRSVPATVCWQGISSEHGCHGYGVQYDTP
jgi:hypothetical protein